MSDVTIVSWDQYQSIDDEAEAKELNTVYLKVGDEVVRCYLNHENYNAYAESNSLQASVIALQHLTMYGYEPVLRG